VEVLGKSALILFRFNCMSQLSRTFSRVVFTMALAFLISDGLSSDVFATCGDYLAHAGGQQTPATPSETDRSDGGKISVPTPCTSLACQSRIPQEDAPLATLLITNFRQSATDVSELELVSLGSHPDGLFTPLLAFSEGVRPTIDRPPCS